MDHGARSRQPLYARQYSAARPLRFHKPQGRLTSDAVSASQSLLEWRSWSYPEGLPGGSATPLRGDPKQVIRALRCIIEVNRQLNIDAGAEDGQLD